MSITLLDNHPLPSALKKEFQKNEINWADFVAIQTEKNERALNVDFGISSYYLPKVGEIVNVLFFVLFLFFIYVLFLK